MAVCLECPKYISLCWHFIGWYRYCPLLFRKDEYTSFPSLLMMIINRAGTLAQWVVKGQEIAPQLHVNASSHGSSALTLETQGSGE